MSLRDDAGQIIDACLESVRPDEIVKKALRDLPEHSGKTILVAIGKAAYRMMSVATQVLGDSYEKGVCITKYGHAGDALDRVACFEAGHPVVDDNSVAATRQALEYVQNLTRDDLVVFLVSGGGSALFEDPLLPLPELQGINTELLKSGASITEINTIRKRFSAVKGGRFAKKCEPALVYSIILSDIVGDPLDMIASGPAYPDMSGSEDAMRIVEKYSLSLSEETLKLLKAETPKRLDNVTTVIAGSVRELCSAAKKKCEELGYKSVVLTSAYEGEASFAGKFLALIAKEHAKDGQKLAFIMGGESVVKVKGTGLGGRNQELALSAAVDIEGLENTCVFSLGSDGTDGPTDAAGGIVFGDTVNVLRSKGLEIADYLENNDSYHALCECDGLIITGPTGTNVNDVAVLLID